MNLYPRTFWGLGWGLFYVVGLYLLAFALALNNNSFRRWGIPLVSIAAATVSTLLLLRDPKPPGLLKPILLALHYFCLACGILLTVLSLIY